MAEKPNLPEGMDEERFLEALEDFKRKFENLKDPETRDEAISLVTREITDKFEPYLAPIYHEEAKFEVEGEIASLLSQIISYLLGEE